MEELLKKIEKLKGEKGVDLSMEEDLSLAIMNLISLEEHFFFTAQKTGKDKYLKNLEETRELRKKLLAKMIPQNEGETWCICKHLLATTMRLMEVGTKLQTMKKERQAKQAFEDAYRVFNIFWGIRLELLKLKDLKDMITKDGEDEQVLASRNKPWDMEDIVAKLIDCCRE